MNGVFSSSGPLRFVYGWTFRIPDLQLSSQNPRRGFMRKAVEYEIRLAYYDRIARTLPEELQDPEAQVVPDQAPGPDYEYDDSGSCCFSLY